MENLPSYFLDPYSYWEWFKGGIFLCPRLFVTNSWWLILILLYARAYIDYWNAKWHEKNKTKSNYICISCIIVVMYICSIIFVIAPTYASSKQDHEWYAFKEQCLKEHKYELLQQIWEIRDKNK